VGVVVKNTEDHLVRWAGFFQERGDFPDGVHDVAGRQGKSRGDFGFARFAAMQFCDNTM